MNTDVLRRDFLFLKYHIKINVPYFFISLVKSFGVSVQLGACYTGDACVMPVRYPG